MENNQVTEKQNTGVYQQLPERILGHQAQCQLKARDIMTNQKLGVRLDMCK